MPGNKDQVIYDDIVILRRHLIECTGCYTAIKCKDTLTMCRQGILMALNVAAEMDDVVKLRTRAVTAFGGFILPCPDPSKHGKSYSITATPMIAVAAQDRLF